MAFHVYPDPQTAALTVVPGATTSTPITQLTGPPPAGFTYNKMMYMRVAVTGAPTAPTLFMQAGTGDAVAVTGSPKQVYRTPGANPLDYVGDVQFVTIGEDANVIQVRLGFDQDTAETLQFGIKNNDAANQDFTWVVAETIGETAQPWIDVSPATLTYASLVNDVNNLKVQVANKGTAPLTVTSVSPALPAGFSVTTPFTVPEGTSKPLVITFTAPATPPPGGPVTGTVDLVATPPDSTALTAAGHNQQIAVSATTQLLEVVLLLDDSGSMSWDPLANPLPDNSPNSRWSELATAANGFLTLLAHFGHNRGRFGIARFPAGNPVDPSTFDIVPMTDIPDSAGMKTAQDAVAAITPLNGTPMGDGLDRVLAPAPGYFNPDPQNRRRWLILMSDGANNSGTHNPLEFVAPPVGTAPAGRSLAELEIELYAVAYGINGHSDVNHTLMKQLADGSLNGGQDRNVDEPPTPMNLAQDLRSAIKSGLTNAMSPLDPSGVLVIGSGPARHDVVITDFDTRAAFVLDWNTPDAERLRLELVTPLCEVITPENAGQGAFSGVTFHGTDRSNMYLVDPSFLQPPESPGLTDRARGSDSSSGSRAGTWTFVITSPSPIPITSPGIRADEGVDVEQYLYDTLVDSTLRLDLSQDRPTYYAGDPITVSGLLTADGFPVTGASVSLSTTLPDGSVANFLAALDIPADALERAKQQLAGKDATPILVKQLAARLAGFVFDIGKRTVTLPMTDPDDTGVYRAIFADTSVPEQYTFYVTANGITADGVPFRREGKLQTFVLVRPDAADSSLDIRQVQPGVVQVTIVPRDRFGNVLLIDPTTAGGFGLTAPGATLGPLTSNLDGTYGTVVTFDPSHPPAIGLEFDGTPVLAPTPVPVLDHLHYADRVVAFHQGQIINANQHADPHAALGSVADKPAGTFVSLGGYGQLTVAIEGEVIESGGEHDITVFIEPDTDLRSYRVEALACDDDDDDDDDGDRDRDRDEGRGRGDGGDRHGGGDDDHGHGRERWVPLGTSIGVTQSFGLGAAHVSSAAAIRITDTSGRGRDNNSTPLATPGVSVRGVGARRVCARDGNGGHGHGHRHDHGHSDG